MSAAIEMRQTHRDTQPLTDSASEHQIVTENRHRTKALGSLFKAPVIRQFVHDDALYREAQPRAPGRFELFFDLVFVSQIRQFAEHLAEEFTILNACKFVILFFPAYSIWQETRNFINVSGTDDLIQRMMVLATMALLIGYSANAGGIKISHDSIPAEFDGLRATFLFYVTAKALRLLFFIVYAFWLANFRGFLTVNSILHLIGFAIYLPLAFTKSEKVFWIIGTVGVFYELLMRSLVAAWASFDLRTKVRSTTSWFYVGYRPSINIEHHIERTSQFIIIVLGEMVLNILYTASAESDNLGVSEQYGKAVLGLLIAFMICWIYFDADNAHSYMHAVRRHWASASAYTVLHFPLIASLILVGSAMINLVTEESVIDGVRWYLGSGLGAALVIMAVLGGLHQNLDARGTALVPPTVVLILRAAAGVAFVVIPLGQINDPTLLMGIYAAGLTGVVLLETVAKLGATPADPASLPAGIIPDPVEKPRQPPQQRHDDARTRLHEALTDAEIGEEDLANDADIGKYQIRPSTVAQRRAACAQAL